MTEEIELKSMIEWPVYVASYSSVIKEHTSSFLEIIQSLFKPHYHYFLIKGKYKGVAYKTKLFRHHIVVELLPPIQKKVFFSYETVTKVHTTSRKKQAFFISFFSELSHSILERTSKTYINYQEN